MSGLHEVIVAAGFLTFAESEGDGGFATGFETLTPEVVGNFHGCEGHGIYGIAVVGCFGALGLHRESQGGYRGGDEQGF